MGKRKKAKHGEGGGKENKERVKLVDRVTQKILRIKIRKMWCGENRRKNMKSNRVQLDRR